MQIKKIKITGKKIISVCTNVVYLIISPPFDKLRVAVTYGHTEPVEV